MFDDKFSRTRPPLYVQPGRINKVDDLQRGARYVRHWCRHSMGSMEGMVEDIPCSPDNEIVTMRGRAGKNVKLESLGGGMTGYTLESLGFEPTPSGWFHRHYLAPYTEK